MHPATNRGEGRIMCAPQHAEVRADPVEDATTAAGGPMRMDVKTSGCIL